jgi:hypothetical protein
LEHLERRDTPSFLAPSAYPAGTINPAPGDIVVGDFNGDGAPDLATGHDSSFGSVSILLNDGAGAYLPQSIYGAEGTNVKGVAAGDFNEDGFDDLATASYGNNNNSTGRIAVFLSNGDATFKPKEIYSAGGKLTSIATADLNGDGNLDLAVTSDQGHVAILRGMGTGKFRRVGLFGSGPSPRSLIVADFNGDSRFDLALGNTSGGGSVGVLLNAGNGTFDPLQSYPIHTIPQAITPADVTGDGKLDIVAAGNSGGVSILPGIGDGTFGTPMPVVVGGQLKDVAAADFDSDDDVDLALTDGSFLFNGALHVLAGTGDGGFADPVTYGSGECRGIVAANLTGDGAIDLAAACPGSAIVLVYQGLGNGEFIRGRTNGAKHPLFGNRDGG